MTDPIDDDVIATVAVENHPYAVKLARDEMLAGVRWAALAVVVIGTGALLGALRPLIIPAIVGLVWCAKPVLRYRRVVREDPVARWRRETREDGELATRRREFELRSAAVDPIATGFLIVVIATVTAIEFVSGGVRAAIPAAALVKPAVRSGEWWRLLTASYLHGSLMHIVANMTSLWSLGRLVEIYDRPTRVPLVFLASALGCSLLSTLLLTSPSLGASGGVMGLVGYLLVTAGAQTDGVPEWLRKRMWVLVLNVAITGIVGFRYIDNAGHAGGLIAGGIVGYVLRSAKRAEANRSDVDLPGSVSMMVLLAGAAFTIYRLIAY